MLDHTPVFVTSHSMCWFVLSEDCSSITGSDGKRFNFTLQHTSDYFCLKIQTSSCFKLIRYTISQWNLSSFSFYIFHIHNEYDEYRHTFHNFYGLMKGIIIFFNISDGRVLKYVKYENYHFYHFPVRQ